MRYFSEKKKSFIKIPENTVWDCTIQNEHGADGSVQDREREQKRNPKSKYTCVGCSLNIWTKPGVKVACVPCSTVICRR